MILLNMKMQQVASKWQQSVKPGGQIDTLGEKIARGNGSRNGKIQSGG